MRSRDLLLSGADYDWITNYATKWITGHEISWTDTRTTSRETTFTEKVPVTTTGTTLKLTTKPGAARNLYKQYINYYIYNIHESRDAEPDGLTFWYEGISKYVASRLGISQIEAVRRMRAGMVPTAEDRKVIEDYVWGVHKRYATERYIKSYYWVSSQGIDVKLDGWSAITFRDVFNKAQDLTYNELSRKYGNRPIPENIVLCTPEQWDANPAYWDEQLHKLMYPWTYPEFKRIFSESLDKLGSSYDQYRLWLEYEPDDVIVQRVPYKHTTTSTRTVRRTTHFNTTYKLYRWTYYQTSQSTSRTTKWYTDRYSATTMAGVDPNQRANGHILSQTYYDRNDEVKRPAIGSISRSQGLDPNSNKWMESREDRQANQSMSKNLYSNNKNELLQTPNNKRNLQTYYVHNEPVS